MHICHKNTQACTGRCRKTEQKVPYGVMVRKTDEEEAQKGMKEFLRGDEDCMSQSSVKNVGSGKTRTWGKGEERVRRSYHDPELAISSLSKDKGR